MGIQKLMRCFSNRVLAEYTIRAQIFQNCWVSLSPFKLTRQRRCQLRWVRKTVDKSARGLTDEERYRAEKSVLSNEWAERSTWYKQTSLCTTGSLPTSQPECRCCCNCPALRCTFRLSLSRSLTSFGECRKKTLTEHAHPSGSAVKIDVQGSGRSQKRRRH